MAGKDAKSKPDRKVRRQCARKTWQFGSRLGPQEVLDRHSELRSEAEAIATGMLTRISRFSIADEIEDALIQIRL